MSTSCSLRLLQERSCSFLAANGRRPRILLSHIQHESSTWQLKSLAIVFADAGFDVDIGPGVYDHNAVAKMACENDVHVVGISCAPADHTALVKELNCALAALGEDNIKIYVETEITGIRMMNRHSDFENLASRSAAETLTLIGA